MRPAGSAAAGTGRLPPWGHWSPVRGHDEGARQPRTGQRARSPKRRCAASGSVRATAGTCRRPPSMESGRYLRCPARSCTALKPSQLTEACCRRGRRLRPSCSSSRSGSVEEPRDWSTPPLTPNSWSSEDPCARTQQACAWDRSPTPGYTKRPGPQRRRPAPVAHVRCARLARTLTPEFAGPGLLAARARASACYGPLPGVPVAGVGRLAALVRPARAARVPATMAAAMVTSAPSIKAAASPGASR